MGTAGERCLWLLLSLGYQVYFPALWRSSQAASHYHIRTRPGWGIKNPLPTLPPISFHRSKAYNGTLWKPVSHGWRPFSLESSSSPGYQCSLFTLHTGRHSGPSRGTECLPASISQTISRGTWAIYRSEQSTREGSTWRWSTRAASGVNTLDHSCASSRLALLGNPSVASSQTRGQTHHLEEGIPSRHYSPEPMLFVAFSDVFDRLSRLICLQNKQLSSVNFHRTRVGSCDFLGSGKEKTAFLQQRRCLQYLLQKWREAKVIQILENQNGLGRGYILSSQTKYNVFPSIYTSFFHDH